jgi:heptosyltransferase-2
MKNQRVLIIMPNWIGDAVMAQPLCNCFMPRILIFRLMCWLQPGLQQVVRAMPEVSEVIQAPFRHGALQLRERLAFVW